MLLVYSIGIVRGTFTVLPPNPYYGMNQMLNETTVIRLNPDIAYMIDVPLF